MTLEQLVDKLTKDDDIFTRISLEMIGWIDLASSFRKSNFVMSQGTANIFVEKIDDLYLKLKSVGPRYDLTVVEYLMNDLKKNLKTELNIKD